MKIQMMKILTMNMILSRSNVMDIVEDYEGSTLDTDTYTYREPEKR